ncbi:helix-turn-helix domain-containing protein [Microbacterium algeriense]|uniref:helix-turn-helix domain-containing protein n=1 Tax=Microbacterium algeriense TaxID=2615184 RepID=UPI0022E7365E|nr:helix-turn-helix transcriptional regulator [Microbacterium algeriense]
MATDDDDALKQRNTLFQAISWLGSESDPSTPGTGGAEASDVAKHLRTLYSTTRTITTPGGVKKTVTSISKADAAKALGVSVRTVQRWLKGDHNPKKTTMDAIRKKARQAITTKRGRQQMVRRARANQSIPGSWVKVAVSGRQGPLDASDPHYARDRTIQQKITPEEYENFRNAWAMGGDVAAREYLESVLSARYLPDWKIGHISSMNVNGVDAGDDRSDPRASR